MPEPILEWNDAALRDAVYDGGHLAVKMGDSTYCHWCRSPMNRLKMIVCPGTYAPRGDYIEPPPEIPQLKGATLEQAALALLQQGKSFDVILALAASWIDDVHGSLRYPNLDRSTSS